MQHNYTLIRVATKDSLYLSGHYQPGSTKNIACIFVHGFGGDFYSNQFIHAIAQRLQAQENAFLSIQTRGTGLRTKIYTKSGRFIYAGARHERLEDAHLDIGAFIEFLMQEGYEQFALMGHSLGTIKIMRYMVEGEHKSLIKKLILLAPFDKNAALLRRAPQHRDELVASAKAKIDTGHGDDIIPNTEDSFGVSYLTFYSWYIPGDLNDMWDFYKNDYTFPLLTSLDVPILALLGDKDAHVTYPEFHETPSSVLGIIKAHSKSAQTVLLPKTGHRFEGSEQAVAEHVAKFIK